MKLFTSTIVFATALSAFSASLLNAAQLDVQAQEQVLAAMEKRLATDTPQPCSGLPATLNLGSLSYTSARTSGNYQVSVSFPDLSKALCTQDTADGTTYFLFTFSSGTQPALTIKQASTSQVTQQLSITKLSMEQSSDAGSPSFVRVYTSLQDLSTLTIYPATSTLAENIGSGSIPVVIPVVLGFHVLP